jgi:Short C-terminal domain
VGLFLRPRRPLLRLAAGAATATIADRAGQRRTEQDADSEQAVAAYEASPAPPPAYAAPAPGTDTIAELEKLARLHESGALSGEEFTAAKARVLGV